MEEGADDDENSDYHEEARCQEAITNNFNNIDEELNLAQEIAENNKGSNSGGD